jgi:hypothetical protein
MGVTWWYSIQFIYAAAAANEGTDILHLAAAGSSRPFICAYY